MCVCACVHCIVSCMCTALAARIVASVLNISSPGLSPITKLHDTGHLAVLVTDVNTAVCHYKD